MNIEVSSKNRTISLRSSADIVHEMILGIGNPKRRSLVIRGTNANARVPRPCPEIVAERVVVLASIFEEVAVPVGVKGDVVLYQDVMGAVNDDAALLALSDHVPAHDAAGDAAGHVKMDGIPSEDALLAKVAYLDPLNVLGDVWGVQDDEMTAVEGVVGSVGRSVSLRLEDDGTAEPRHLGRHAGILGLGQADRILDGIRVGEAELGGCIGGLDRHEGLGGLDRPDDLILPASRRLGVGDQDLAVGSRTPALGRFRIGNGDLMGLGQRLEFDIIVVNSLGRVCTHGNVHGRSAGGDGVLRQVNLLDAGDPLIVDRWGT